MMPIKVVDAAEMGTDEEMHWALQAVIALALCCLALGLIYLALRPG